jgi:hypothetical protein
MCRMTRQEKEANDLGVGFFSIQDWPEQWTDLNPQQKYPTPFFHIMTLNANSQPEKILYAQEFGNG